MFKNWDWTTVGEVAAGIIVAGVVVGFLARRR